VLEDFGADELRRRSLDPYTFETELAVRIARGLGVCDPFVPLEFPLGIADALRASGVELIPDQKLFDDRRRRKTQVELAGIRRAQRAAEAGVAAARDLFHRAERSNGGLVVEGEPVTCELVKKHVQAALLENGASAQELIVSHGAQTAIGHVIAIEPGLYRHGFGGVRLEDLLRVTDDGSELLTDCPYDLEVST
jgi:Xaa-Pro aminopeptidase